MLRHYDPVTLLPRCRRNVPEYIVLNAETMARVSRYIEYLVARGSYLS